MRFFFIDLENVRSEGLEGVLSLGSDDMVFIYYSDNAMNLSIPTMENLNNSKASKKFIKTNYIGKNAMDFQIVSLFGAMIERNHKGSYYIISQDNGFRSAVSFCESFFEDYNIMCGVYPTIISAITDEMKRNTKTVKISSGKKAEAPVKEKQDNSSAKNDKSAKKEKKSVKEEKDNQEVIAEENEESSNALQSEAAENGAEEPKKASKKRRRRKKKSVDREETENNATETEVSEQAEEIAEPEVKKEQNVQALPEVRYGYIYDILKELLSEKTISIYAASIDEGIAKCKNRDELHSFLRDRYGEDEGEALYRVTQGDFETMKQSRPHKPSRSRHRSKKNRSADNKTIS